MVQLCTAEPAEVGSTSPAGDLIAALVLLDGSVAVRAVAGVVLEVVLAGQAGCHVLQLLLAVPVTTTITT